jgi:hypothetical protein
MGGEQVNYGYKGKGNTLHLITDCEGRPLPAILTAANGEERLELPKLLDNIGLKRMSRMEAGKGYDSRFVRKKGLYPLILHIRE